MRRYRVGAAPRKRSISELRAIAREKANKPKGGRKGKTMKKLMMAAIAATALAATGCKHIEVKTNDWSASYTTLLQSNDTQGLKVQAGEHVHFELEKSTSNTDPAVSKVLDAAADALKAASKACSGGACGE